MKKVLLICILNLAVGITSSQAQGYVHLDNYFSSYGGPLITYGPTGGGLLGTGINNTFTVGIYLGQGGFAGSVAADATPYGNDIPTSLHPSLLLGTGLYSTTPAGYQNYGGYFSANGYMQASAAPGTTITAMVVAYNGADYATSSIRGHSPAFQLVTWTGQPVPPVAVGPVMGSFQVNQVPEPTTLTLAGLGLASLLVTCRRK